jgi:hypothetical protein
MKHPYQGIDPRQRWSKAMAGREAERIDPVMPPPFRIHAASRVVTAGSCFAQHVARHLRARGLPCIDTEPAHPLLGGELATAFGYGIYAARYGNIYTARQLLQLWLRATGELIPADDAWCDDGIWHDPFRPTIQPGGFPSRREYEEDRRRHFAAVRKAFSEMDVFVFTLGLTECWIDRIDGAVYPLCPGVAAGRYDGSRHLLCNFGVAEVVGDLQAFVKAVRRVNPGMKMILTVSPVALAATAEPRHVLLSNTWSKAVLRLAAEELCAWQDVYYFPAYEIVNAGGAAYLAADRRSVLEPGVERVMALFFQHVVEAGDIPATSLAQDGFLDRGHALMQALCDEQRLDPAGSKDDAVRGAGS